MITRKRFEYKLLPESRGTLDVMNPLGEEGWELVCITPAYCVFKRELSEPRGELKWRRFPDDYEGND